jgi:N-hydroxyarylamine O-acetyltransferase
MPDRSDVDRLIERLSIRGAPTVGWLHELQRQWCFAQPFHNLDLLAGAASQVPPLGREEAIRRCADGLGGPCHVQACGLHAVLAAVACEAEFAAATIGSPGDHLLVRATIDSRTFLCDVGNGQPYLRPFPENDALVQEHLGWRVSSTPEQGSLVVERTSPDQPVPRRVYRTEPGPRQWENFSDIIRRHHSEIGFGPFLTGLRVVRMGPDLMVTVRDEVVTRYRAGSFERSVKQPLELVRFLRDDLCLGSLPVSQAVDSWLARRAR